MASNYISLVEGVLVAAIMAVGGTIAALIQRGRKENRSDHGMVVEALGRIEEKIDDHIADHARGEFDG